MGGNDELKKMVDKMTDQQLVEMLERSYEDAVKNFPSNGIEPPRGVPFPLLPPEEKLKRAKDYRRSFLPSGDSDDPNIQIYNEFINEMRDHGVSRFFND